MVSPTVIKAPLWDVATKGPTAYAGNDAFVREYVANLLASSFPNLSQQQVCVRVLVQVCVQVLVQCIGAVSQL